MESLLNNAHRKPRPSPSNAALDAALTLCGEPCHVQIRIPIDHPAFEGHFPGAPILPGIAQIGLARLAAEQLTGQAWQLQEIRRAKFVRPVPPGQLLLIEMNWKRSPEADSNTEGEKRDEKKLSDLFDFTLKNERGELFSQFQLCLTALSPSSAPQISQ